MICEKGSDWGKIQFKSVETGLDLSDLLENVKFSCLTWTHDSKGIFYNQYPKSIRSDGTATEKNEFQQLFYHKIGTEQSEDILVAKFEDPSWMGHAEMSDCGTYLLIGISKSSAPVNMEWFVDLRKYNFEIDSKLEFVKLINNFDAQYEVSPIS